MDALGGFDGGVLEFKHALRETVHEFARRARREAALHARTDLVPIGVMNVMAPCTFEGVLAIPPLPEDPPPAPRADGSLGRSG